MRSPLHPVLILLAGLFAVAPGCQEKQPRRYSDTSRAGLSGGQLLFEEDFSGGLDRWQTRSRNWRLEDGALYSGDGPNENEGLWLKEGLLPRNFRVEFDVRSVQGNNPVFEGDMKCELGGDRPEHIAGYVFIFGGWKNSINTIARLEEHTGRLVTDTTRKVEENRTYRMAIVRLGGELRWFIDGAPFLSARDPEVLTGAWFGFNNWNSRFYVDNVRIFGL